MKKNKINLFVEYFWLNQNNPRCLYQGLVDLHRTLKQQKYILTNIGTYLIWLGKPQKKSLFNARAIKAIKARPPRPPSSLIAVGTFLSERKGKKSSFFHNGRPFTHPPVLMARP